MSPEYRVKVQGFKASSNMLSTGVLGFYFADDRLHYDDRYRNEEKSKWIVLLPEERLALHDMLAEVHRNPGGERAQNRLRGAVVTLIKYVRQFHRDRIQQSVDR